MVASPTPVLSWHWAGVQRTLTDPQDGMENPGVLLKPSGGEKRLPGRLGCANGYRAHDGTEDEEPSSTEYPTVLASIVSPFRQILSNLFPMKYLHGWCTPTLVPAWNVYMLEGMA